MTISKKERAELRNFCQMALGRGCPLPNRDIREIPKLTLKALDALEAAEARAEAAEREREMLADKLSIYGPDCPREIDKHFDILCSYRENPGSGGCDSGGKECWLEWAQQQDARRRRK